MIKLLLIIGCISKISTNELWTADIVKGQCKIPYTSQEKDLILTPQEIQRNMKNTVDNYYKKNQYDQTYNVNPARLSNYFIKRTQKSSYTYSRLQIPEFSLDTNNIKPILLYSSNDNSPKQRQLLTNRQHAAGEYWRDTTDPQSSLRNPYQDRYALYDVDECDTWNNRQQELRCIKPYNNPTKCSRDNWCPCPLNQENLTYIADAPRVKPRINLALALQESKKYYLDHTTNWKKLSFKPPTIKQKITTTDNITTNTWIRTPEVNTYIQVINYMALWGGYYVWNIKIRTDYSKYPQATPKRVQNEMPTGELTRWNIQYEDNYKESQNIYPGEKYHQKMEIYEAYTFADQKFRLGGTYSRFIKHQVQILQISTEEKEMLSLDIPPTDKRIQQEFTRYLEENNKMIINKCKN